MDNLIMETIGSWALGLFQANPAFAALIMFIGTARLAVKPLMTLLQIYVKFTPYDADDKWLASVEKSKGYKLALYLMDWILSVKGK